MKTRITYIHGADSEFDPSQASLTENSLSLRSLKAAKQERIIFPVSWPAFRSYKKFHIRWASERPFATNPPFSSKISPGLGLSYTLSETPPQSSHDLCALLREIFSEDLKCTDAQTTFSTSETSCPSSPNYRFHQSLPSLSRFYGFAQQVLCRDDVECQERVASFSSVSSLDIDYDDSTKTTIITGYWPESPTKDGWTETIYTPAPAANSRVEIGILAAQPAQNSGDVKVGGFLAILGEDNKLKPALFSFPSRHHSLSDLSVYSAHFLPPTGLHPTLQLSMRLPSRLPHEAPRDSTCGLYTYLTLPSTIFADKYQLSTQDRLFLQSHNLLGLESIEGEVDLEAPDWTTKQWGSKLLLALATPGPESRTRGPEWNVTIPLHLRYLHPSNSGYQTVSIPWPVLFYACRMEESASSKSLDINPFDRGDLGWETNFPARTLYYYLNPSVEQQQQPKEGHVALVETLSVPVLNMGQDSQETRFQIQAGSVIVIVAGFLWILWKLSLVARGSGIAPKSEPGAAEKKVQ
ncbi:protease B nonderepressible form [Myotisia sp. PD_48]|nr:protease B nonderepressible form [Myotisia sp. PD_48]